jgi:hypothetical protein
MLQFAADVSRSDITVINQLRLEQLEGARLNRLTLCPNIIPFELQRTYGLPYPQR